MAEISKEIKYEVTIKKEQLDAIAKTQEEISDRLNEVENKQKPSISMTAAIIGIFVSILGAFLICYGSIFILKKFDIPSKVTLALIFGFFLWEWAHEISKDFKKKQQ